ncbi:MAG: GNAT family N-acyltransferase, partial [Pseudomonadota bacterium]
RDEDGFDAHCHHLIVEDLESHEIVGTYRLQSRAMARAGSGFYSAAEFALDELGNEILDEAIELGRACIDEKHRNTRVLFLLWRGLATYMQASGNRYFFGCCSLTSQSPAEGVAMFAKLRAGDAVDAAHLVSVQPRYACVPAGAVPTESPDIPKLMGLYLTYGARIVSGPALDREFGTIDFLALFDLESLRPAHRKLFLEPRQA